MSEEKMIKFESDAAAVRTTVTGWVSSNGRFCGDGEHGERAARFDGCTHRKCEDCDGYAVKHYSACEPCREKYRIEKYKSRKAKPYEDGDCLYSDVLDKYFYCFDELQDYIDEDEDENNPNIESLRIVHCDKTGLHTIDSENWVDDLPEDCQLPHDVYEAMMVFNKVIETCGGNYFHPNDIALEVSE